MPHNMTPMKAQAERIIEDCNRLIADLPEDRENIKLELGVIRNCASTIRADCVTLSGLVSQLVELNR